MGNGPGDDGIGGDDDAIHLVSRTGRLEHAIATNSTETPRHPVPVSVFEYRRYTLSSRSVYHSCCRDSIQTKVSQVSDVSQKYLTCLKCESVKAKVSCDCLL